MGRFPHSLTRLAALAALVLLCGSTTYADDLDDIEFEVEAVEWTLVAARLEVSPDQPHRADSAKGKDAKEAPPLFSSVTDIQNQKRAWELLKERIAVPQGAVSGSLLFGWRPSAPPSQQIAGRRATTTGFEIDEWPAQEGKGLVAGGASSRAFLRWDVRVDSSEGDAWSHNRMLRHHFEVVSFSLTLHPLSPPADAATPLRITEKNLEAALRTAVVKDAEPIVVKQLERMPYRNHKWEDVAAELDGMRSGGVSILELGGMPRTSGAWEVRLSCVVRGRVSDEEEYREESVSGAVRFAVLAEGVRSMTASGERSGTYEGPKTRENKPGAKTPGQKTPGK